MCGRFTLIASPEDLIDRFELIDGIPFDIIPRYNAAPSQFLSAIINVNGKNRIGKIKWGLIPSWAKDEKMAFNMINAKSETLREKPAFKGLLTRKRCLIPADGFYEWMKLDNRKQPMRIMMKSGEIFSFAGLYDTWINPVGDKVHTCTIITTKPNELVAEIHDRMPAILKREDESVWLDRNVQDGDLLESLLSSYDKDQMMAYPVPALVGNVKNDLPECIVEMV
ncbi:SOS response-associated peptidase [Brevibacillus sp. NRS-1366]|uniref:SOS response-associated peptidase n=1 Tax=Brevibacillus sp. NRS-1366 TaxID=3233899 RepID=UPI003D1EFFC3